MYNIYRYVVRKIVRNYKNKYLRIKLNGGLSNKLHCLFSASDIALQKEAYIVEPDFGWNNKIPFSDIYDIDYFNKEISNYNYGKDLMITKDKLPKNNLLGLKVIDNNINLWDHSGQELAEERKSGVISTKSTKIRVLKALKLKPEYESIVKEYVSRRLDIAMQIRTESDWKEYAERKKLSDSKESIFVSLDRLIDMIPTVSKSKNIFFTSGENHDEITSRFEKLNYNVNYFFDPKLEYEINAAINFEICSRANIFIGNSRSSYSNLISLKRAILLDKDNSYIYNYGDKIHRRVDKGLQPFAASCISKKTTIY